MEPAASEAEAEDKTPPWNESQVSDAELSGDEPDKTLTMAGELAADHEDPGARAAAE